MTRRNDVLKTLLKSDKNRKEKTVEEKFLAATADLIIRDLVDIAIQGLNKRGPGSLVINLCNDSTTYMSGHAIELDAHEAEQEGDEETLDLLRVLMAEIEENDYSKNVLLTVISDEGTTTFPLDKTGAH